MDKHWWELYYALPEDEQYDIDMDLYAEFNNTYCFANSTFGYAMGIETPEQRKKVITETKRAESRKRKELTKKKVLQMLERAKTKDERRWEIDKLIDEEMEKRK